MLAREDTTRLVLFCGGLFGVLGLVDATVDYGARHVVAGDAGKISQVMLHTAGAGAELVVFGASNAETGISPAVLEHVTSRRAANLAVDGTGVEQYGALVREYLRYGRRDATVLLVVNVFSFHAQDLPTAPSWYYPHIDNVFVYEAMAPFDPAVAWRTRYVPFYDFSVHDSTYYRNAATGLVAALRGTALDSGFIAHHEDWVDMPPEALRDVPAGGVDPRVVARFDALIAAIEASGRKVVLVFPPLTNDAMRVLPGVAEVAAELPRLHPRTLDYHLDPMGNDHRWFYNHTHLNARGAERFSTMLGRDLRRVLGGGEGA